MSDIFIVYFVLIGAGVVISIIATLVYCRFSFNIFHDFLRNVIGTILAISFLYFLFIGLAKSFLILFNSLTFLKGV